MRCLDRLLSYIPENVIGILLFRGFPHLRSSRNLSYLAGIVLRDVSFYLADMLYNLDLFFFSIAIINVWAKQLSSAFTSTTLLLCCAMTHSGLPLHLIA